MITGHDHAICVTLLHLAYICYIWVEEPSEAMAMMPLGNSILGVACSSPSYGMCIE
jgi:hypothetical protein